MRRWEKRRPVRVSHPIQVEVYNLDKARAAQERMQTISSKDLYAKLTTPGQDYYLPYPGIGVPPRRPGGDLNFVARADLDELFRVFDQAYSGSGQGYIVYVTGPKGLGKSCYLRAFAWVLILTGHEEKLQSKIVCLWSMESAYANLLAELIAALRFTYCQVQDVLQAINSLKSLEDVEKFMDSRLALGEKFYFIVDGAEVLDANTSEGTPRPDKDRRADVEMQMWSLLQKAYVSVIALSPMADSSRKLKPNAAWVHFEEGFWKEEYDTYINKASILGRLPHRKDDIAYFAGEHPLSLSVLDSSCRLYAQKRRETSDSCKRKRFVFNEPLPGPTDDEIVNLVQDTDDWVEVVKLFVSSAEMTSIRVLLEKTLSSLPSACHSQVSMMVKDMRFVVGDPETEVADYVTPYIKRMYNEGFREAESRRVYENTAWQHYCRYLLDQGGPLNWAEMGWLVENLAAEVIGFKGLNLDRMHIRTARTQRFGGVPDYSSWIFKVEAGGAIYFIPIKYNYRSIDGLVVWRDGSGTLHLLAIQVTVNHEKHQASATEFMSFNTIVNWIPKEELPKWELHFLFLCMQSVPTKVVPESLTPMRSGGFYGSVKYSKHTISFQDAFGDSLDMDMWQTLKDVATRRDEASEPVADEEARSEAKAIADAVAAGPPPAPGVSPQVAEFIQGVLSRSEFTKQKLENIAKHHKIAVSQTDLKPTLIAKICKGVLEL